MTSSGSETPAGETYPVIAFNQFAAKAGPGDELLLFSAPAKEIAQWAGIPRKGWRIRMLYQRWVTDARGNELRAFWDEAAAATHGGYIRGPTAITVALHGTPEIKNDRISLAYASAANMKGAANETMQTLAQLVAPRVAKRLDKERGEALATFAAAPLKDLPDVGHDYVFEFSLQLAQMSADPSWFIGANKLAPQDVNEIIVALESICRPATVVDGQHRLLGAAQSVAEVWLPVVAMPDCGWVDEVYQFIVINEKAQKVEKSLLTDIFGSSLTPTEQGRLGKKLARANVDVEARVAAVIANRDEGSPFFNMVVVRLQGDPPKGVEPYVSEQTIRLLIDGGGRGSRGWRSDDEFYDAYVRPTFPDRAGWESWSGGLWREYWFAFWRTIGDHYDEQAQKEKKDSKFVLWRRTGEPTNLTKAVSLRLFQKFFMERAIERMESLDGASEVLIETLGEEKATEIIEAKRKTYAIPATVDKFADHIRSWFLDPGIPVRTFLYPWVASLDTEEGQGALLDEFEKAYHAMAKGRRYRASSKAVFASGETDDE